MKKNNVKVLCYCMFLQETYSLIDAKYYASNSRIESEGSPYNNDRIIFASSYQVAVGDNIHFRFKTTPPKGIVGIGSNQGSDFVIEKTTSGTYNLWRNRNTNVSNADATEHGFYTTQDLIINVGTGTNGNRANIYQGDTFKNWWFFALNIKKIRVDKFYNYDYDIEVFVL